MPRHAAIAVLIGIGLFCRAATADGPTAAGPEGIWVGRCRLDGKDVFVLLRLQRDGNRITGLAFSPSLGIRTPIADVQVESRRLTLSFRTPDSAVGLSCELRGDELEGTVEYGGSKGACRFRRRQPMDAAAFDAIRGDYQLSPERVVFVGRFATPRYLFLCDGDLRVEIHPVGPREFLGDDLRTIAFEVDGGGRVTAAVISEPDGTSRRAPRVRLYAEEAVTFANGDVRLAGTLTLPASPGPLPAVVLVHGSGPMVRAGYAVEVDRFARLGIATLAFDKRGTGESAGDWQRADFDVLAEDVIAGVQLLRGHPRIRPDKVGLFGVSQAGWVIPLAASRCPDIAFVVPVSGGAVMPADQELWHRRQNLAYLGVPERFIDTGRRVTAMAFDWHRQHQLGSTPIPNPFADDNLNMYHDAAAVLRRVRQPVLAIFGGLDTFTPPRESAAIWADALRQRGDDDYSVRFFPRGSHGLEDGGKTGSAFEILPERGFLPGYFDTIVKWIHHHADGPAFAEARRVDVDPDSVPVESRGMHRVSWYGSGAVQPWQLLISLVVFTALAVVVPAAWLWRRVRRGNDVQPGRARRAAWPAALLGLINVGIMAAMTYVLYPLAQAAPHPIFARLGPVWNGLAVATWLSLVLVVCVVCGCVAAWRHAWWSRTGRVCCTLVALVALGWVPFVFYWELVRPAW